MAYLPQAKTPEEMKKLGVAATREAYNKLALRYNKIIDGDICYCHKCGSFKTSESFYNDKTYGSGLYPTCKVCLLEMATDYDKANKTYKDNKEKCKEVFRMMDLPFIEGLYLTCKKNIEEQIGERNVGTAYQQMISTVKSLPQYRNLHWADSEFDDDDEIIEFQSNKKARKEIKKIFGSGFTENDYVYLQDQYDDWCSRTQVDSKSQEMYVVQICLQSLDIYKDRKSGKDVSNKLKTLDTLMNGANLQPKQNISNAATDSLSFGQLIEKWEQNAPIPEPSPEFKDIDSIGKYIRVWFLGCFSKVLGLKNDYSREFESYINEYTVTKPEFKEEGHSDEIYDRLFGGGE